jgi:hypothetical protein
MTDAVPTVAIAAERGPCLALPGNSGRHAASLAGVFQGNNF